MPDATRPFGLSDFDFALPQALVAQHPAVQRSASRLLDGTSTTPVDRIFNELPTLLRRGDLIVFNDTRVMKARLFGEKPTGGKLELLIERVLGANQVVAHLRASRKPEVGTTIALVGAPGSNDQPRATLLGRWPEPDGALFRLVLSNDLGEDPYALMQRHGHVPLPPYISHTDSAQDAERYQTVFAKHPGAVAAPTAALHFDEALLAAIDAMGVQRAHITLHVGAGTFQPVKTENLDQHQMHSEWYEISASTQQAIAATKARAGRIVGVGTTTVRTLESWARAIGVQVGMTGPLCDSVVPHLTQACGPYSAETSIFIKPGFEFRLVDMMVTNFHLPKSTLMMLVSAFAGYEHVRDLYRHAIASNYRFFSYGDAMLLARDCAARQK